jgi:hypothetical protein
MNLEKWVGGKVEGRLVEIPFHPSKTHKIGDG